MREREIERNESIFFLSASLSHFRQPKVDGALRVIPDTCRRGSVTGNQGLQGKVTRCTLVILLVSYAWEAEALDSLPALAITVLGMEGKRAPISTLTHAGSDKNTHWKATQMEPEN